jgi:aryl-alcohol dehydrogenase-like predicted oxidoreductase
VGTTSWPSPAPGGRLEENVAALDVRLTEDDLARLEPLGEQVVGARY